MRVPFHKAALAALSTAAVLLAVSGGAFAQTTQNFGVLYDFTGATGSQASTSPTAGTVPSGLTAGLLSRGSGLTSSAAGGSISSSSFATGTTLTLSNNDYYTFTVGPNTGNTVNFSTLSYYDQRSSTGPQNFSIRSSVDSFGTDLFTYSSAAVATPEARSFDLTTKSALQNVTAPVEFRIYGFNSGATTGTYRLLTNANSPGLTVSGVLVTPAMDTPEPGSLALLALSAGPATGFVALRRRAARRNKA